jgi:hypothetical protein
LATVILRPTSDHTIVTFLRSSGTDDWYTYIDEETYSDTDYLHFTSTTLAGSLRFNWSDSGIAAGSTINSVTAKFRICKGNASTKGQRTYSYYWGSGTYGGVTDAYVDFTAVQIAMTTNPATSAVWTIAELDALTSGISTTTGNSYATDPTKISHLYLEVDYTAGVGPAKLKTWNGLATAKIKTINGLEIAKVKTINGLP